MGMKWERWKHPFEPYINKDSQILILGSFPSVKSREQMFYYGNPQNRFWKMLSILFNEEIPSSLKEKKALLKKHHIALWDVIKECDIVGSSDTSIINVEVNELAKLIQTYPIDCIIANGKKAGELYKRYCEKETQKEIILCPSTSPANAACSIQKLVSSYAEAIEKHTI